MKYLIPVVALVSISTIEICALLKGVNGVMLGLSFTSIGGVLGYCLKSNKKGSVK